MESDPTMMLMMVAGLFCTLAAILFGVLAFYNMRRRPPSPVNGPVNAPAAAAAGSSRSAVAPATPAATPVAPVTPVVPVTGLTPMNLPADANYDEEEMPTVVVNQPERAPGPVVSAFPAGQRTSGATIIAFDEEEPDDEQQ